MKLLRELLALVEGVYVVKSKDGVERRFKKADSPDALKWKETVAKKPTVPKEKYTQAWWDFQWEKSLDKKGLYAVDERVYPWSDIDKYELDSEILKPAFKEAGWDLKNIDDWSASSAQDVTIDGVTCSCIKIRVTFFYTKDDDLGLDIEDGETVSDSQYILVARDPKNPTKLVFHNYGH